MPDSDQVESRAGFLAWYSLGVLTLAHILALIDRQILSLLVEPIRHDMGLNDVQIGLLTGFAFTLFYATMGLPFGYLADRYKRKTIIAVSLAIWSIMTALCGVAKGFGQLLLARFGVGFGEASLGPCANSLISDLFPAHLLGRAVGIYSLAQSVGVGIALIFGAYALNIINSMPQVDIPLIGSPRPWQLVFFAVGLPGIIVAFLVQTVFEPQRVKPGPGKSAAAGTASEQPDKTSLLPYLGENIHLYFSLWVGFGLVLLAMHSLLMWTPSFQIRVLGWTPVRSGITTGILFSTFGVTGALAGGVIADLYSKMKRPDIMVRITVAIIVCSIPFAGSATLVVENETASLVCLALTILPLWSVATLFMTAILLSTPAYFRGRVMAIAILTGHLIGGGLGPLAVGLINEFVFQDPQALGKSLSIVMLSGLAGGSLILYSGVKVVALQMEKLRLITP